MGKTKTKPKAKAKAKPQPKPGKAAPAGELSKDAKIGLLRRMMEIRAFEDKVFELLARNVLQGASHVYAGQEAVAVGACSAITERDYATSTHRGHGHCIA
ncbi:MAG TPA: thiamine pyrophosphate-dependent enzyme, partial [Phycisphaerae bacterium]|nr:thiamine pyrophosphate-dependent enzyme [Phycisphaerae bacterium]